MLVYGGFLDNSACILLRLVGGSKILWPSGSGGTTCTSNTSSSSSVVVVVAQVTLLLPAQW